MAGDGAEVARDYEIAELSAECARLRAALEASQQEVLACREEVRTTRLQAEGAGAAAEAAEAAEAAVAAEAAEAAAAVEAAEAAEALRAQVGALQVRLAALGGGGGSSGSGGGGGGGGGDGGGGGGNEEAQQLAEELVAVREELIAVRAAHAKQLKQAQAELRKALTAASRQAEGRGEAGGDNQRGAAAAMRVMHEREVSGRQ